MTEEDKCGEKGLIKAGTKEETEKEKKKKKNW